MYKRAILVLIAFFMAWSFVRTVPALAQDEGESGFLTSYDVKYAVSEDGNTKVTHNIIIKNLKSDLIVSSYSILIKQPDISDVSGESKDRRVDVTKTDENGVTKLTARFNDFIIGEGKENKLTVTYNTKSIVNKIGKVWNVNIPKVLITDNMEKYDITLEVSNQLGEMLYITPTPKSVENTDNLIKYNFSKEYILNDGITASFGAYQDINYKLIYQLKNQGRFKSYQEIALPPEISQVQQVKYSSIQPEPKYIKQDKDNNVILGYQLKAKEQIEITVIGNARITGRQIDALKGGAFKDIPSDTKKYTQKNQYWESDSDIVKKVASELYNKNLNVSQNAKNIYDYIVKNYKYDFDIEQQDKIQRKGAERTLLDKNDLGCMEFTDLFIALARAMGIPSRQLNGYALSTDYETKPVDIFLNSQDKLHAWPEYYDPAFGWIQIDPTWGSTSSTDYFSKLDTNHFVFVIRGTDPEFPLSAGEYKLVETANLVEVEFSENGVEVVYDPVFKVEKATTINPLALIKNKRLYKIINTGDTFFYLENGDTVLPNGTKYTYLDKNADKIILKDFNGTSTEYSF